MSAGYAQLTAKGVPAAEAATQMRSAIVALTKVGAPLEALQKKTGRTYLKIAGQKGLVFALEQLRIDAKKAGVPLIDLLGRVEGLNFTLGTTGPNFAGYNKNLQDVTKSQGVAAAQMAERQKGLNAQLNILREGAKSAGITIGSALLPKLTPLVKKLNEFLAKPETQARIADFATGLAAGFEAVAKWAGTIPWDRIADGLGMAAGFAAQLVGVFASMPPEAMAAIVGLGALNKLSGGAVSGVVSELSRGLVKGVLGMTAGVVNLKAGTVVGGPGAAPGGGVAAMTKGGALFGLAKTIGAGLIAGFAVEKLFEQWGAFRAEGAAGAATLERQTTAGVPQLGLADARAALRNVQEQLGNPINDLALKLSGTFDQVKATEKALTDRIAYLEGGGTGTGATGGRGDASTAAEVKRLGDKQALAARIIAAGGTATADRIDAIMEKNARTTASTNEREARRLATLTDTTRSGLASVVAAANATTAAIRNGFTIPAPSVTVTVNAATGFTTRTLTRKTTVNRAINPAPIPGRMPQPI